MDHQQILSLIKQADHQMLELSNTVANLQKHVTALIEENNQLKMVNHQLHDSLLAYQQEDDEISKVSDERQIEVETPRVLRHHQSPGQQRLQEYYNDGVHICHQFFGAHRPQDEACILCLGVLDEISRNSE